jgi:hypothetical protein
MTPRSISHFPAVHGDGGSGFCSLWNLTFRQSRKRGQYVAICYDKGVVKALHQRQGTGSSEWMIFNAISTFLPKLLRRH